MMADFTLISALWSKVGKPIPNALIGLVFLYKAPQDFSWIGWIFLAISMQGFVDWGTSIFIVIKNKYKIYADAAKIKKALESLNKAEKAALVQLYQWQTIEITIEDNNPNNPRNKIELFKNLEKFCGLGLVSFYIGNDFLYKTRVYSINEDTKSILVDLMKQELLEKV